MFTSHLLSYLSPLVRMCLSEVTVDLCHLLIFRLSILGNFRLTLQLVDLMNPFAK